jgi:hypothetical protein
MVRERLVWLMGLVAVPLAVGQEVLVPNLDLAEGGKGWSAWAEKPAHRWAVEPQAGPGGKPALCIEAVDLRGEVMVMVGTDRLQGGERYQLTAWWRTRGLSVQPQADLRVISRDAEGKWRLLLAPAALAQLPDRGQALAALLRERASPAAEAPGTTLELLLRRLADGRHLLCALNRDPDRTTEGTVTVNGAFPRVADVDQTQAATVPSAVQAGRTQFGLRLDPGETAYLLLAK